MSRFLQNKWVQRGVVVLISGLLPFIGYRIGFFVDLNARFNDSLYNINAPSEDIVIIAVDDASTAPSPYGLGRYNDWSRDNFTNLLTQLKAEKPKVIALDFIFHTPTQSVPREKLLELEEKIANAGSAKLQLQAYQDFVKNYRSSIGNPLDASLAQAIKENQNVILAGSVNMQDGTIIKPLSIFSETATVALVSSVIEPDGVIRKSVPHYQGYDDFGLAVAKKYLNKEEIDLKTINDEMYVNFFGEPHSYETVSFVDVINAKYPKGFFTDKIVLVGATSSKSIHDEFYTARSNVLPMPGVEFRANEIQTILEGKFLAKQSALTVMFTLLALSLFTLIFSEFLSITFGTIATIALALLYLFFTQFFYHKGILLNMVFPFISVIFAYCLAFAYRYFISDKKKHELKSAFSHYVSKEVVEEILDKPESVKLGGEKREVTVFFTDIKDSTAYSERTEITLWVSQINEYFTMMERVIQKYGGTLDKYEGDAIMGFWNAPIAQEDHLIRAYSAALEMFKVLEALHQKWAQENKPLIEFRIGLNTGEALVGNFGSENRFDYTVMGDTVNTASRLESSANKTYGTKAIVAGFKLEELPKLQSNFILREIDTVLLPGKKDPVTLYELLGFAQNTSPEIAALTTNYQLGLTNYRQKNFADAKKYFALNATDKPSLTMLARTEKLLNGESIAAITPEMTFQILSK